MCRTSLNSEGLLSVPELHAHAFHCEHTGIASSVSDYFQLPQVKSTPANKLAVQDLPAGVEKVPTRGLLAFCTAREQLGYVVWEGLALLAQAFALQAR